LSSTHLNVRYSKMQKKARAPRRKPEQRTTEILAAARTVFEEYGYANSKVSEIAQRVGVAEGTIFTYFPSKRALIVELIIRWYRQLIEDTGKGLNGIFGTRARLNFIIWHHLKTLLKNDALCAVIIQESRQLQDDVAFTIRKLNREYTDLLQEELQQGIANGDILAGISPSLVRSLVFGGIEHIFWDCHGSNRKIDLDQTADDFAASLFLGIFSPSKSSNLELRLSTLISEIENKLDTKST